MIGQDEYRDDLTGLRRQLKILTIVVVALASAVLFLSFRFFQRAPGGDTGWPDMAVGNLQVKRIALMTDDGKQVGVFSAENGRARLALVDSNRKIRLELSDREDGGHVYLGGNKESATELKNGSLILGNDTVGGVFIQAPPFSPTQITVKDNSGFWAVLGQGNVVNPTDGTVSLTSAASLLGGSKDAAYWSTLLRNTDNPQVPGKSKEGSSKAVKKIAHSKSRPSKN